MNQKIKEHNQKVEQVLGEEKSERLSLLVFYLLGLAVTFVVVVQIILLVKRTYGI